MKMTADGNRLRVYVAGPMSVGDQYENIQAGIRAGKSLLADGYAPMVPHLDAYMYIGVAGDSRVGLEEMLDVDFAWISVADAVLRLPGSSTGADREVVFARNEGVSVFYDRKSLDAWRLMVDGYLWDPEAEPVLAHETDWPSYGKAIGAMNGMEGCE